MAEPIQPAVPSGRSRSPTSDHVVVEAQDHGHVPRYIQTIRDLQSVEKSPGLAGHFLALMKKNALLKLRSPVSTVAEVLLPVLFACGLLVIWAVSSKSDIPVGDFSGGTPYILDNATSYLCVKTGPGVPSLDGIADCGASATVTCRDVPLIPVRGLCALAAPEAVVERYMESFRRPHATPPLDSVLAMQWLMLMTDLWQASDFQAEELSLANSGYLYFAPSGPLTDAAVAYFNQTSRLFKYIVRTAPSFDAIKTIIQAKTWDRHAPGIYAAVTVQGWSNASMDVIYSFNRTGTPWTDEKESAFVNGMGEYHGRMYQLAGFPTVHDYMMQAYAAAFNKSTPAPTVIAPMPYTAYTQNEFLNTVSTLAPLFLTFGYLFLVSQLTKKLVEEKETRMREAMMIMGLGTVPFYLSWILTYVVVAMVGSLLIAVVLIFTVVSNADFFIVWLLFTLFAVSNVMLASLIASFFSASRLAALVAPVVYFVMAIPSFAIPQTSPGGLLIGLSVMSPSAFARGANLLFNYEKTTGANWTNFATDGKGYPMLLVLAMLLIDSAVYLALTLYFDAVLPSEWGTRLHPFFCCLASWCPWVKPREHNRGFGDDGKPKDGRDRKGAFEDQQHSAEPTVRLFGLRKEFDTPAGRITAVDDLTMDLYEDEITVLLGHNGAGKTTAMNLMTGMLDMTAGDCQMYGVSVHDDVHAARQQIGMCPQHNILWDDLTCKEHLEFFAKIKGFGGADLDLAVEAMLAAVDLTDKAHVMSAGLSGGQKRKLSVAIAFVGGSRMIFLDEPTAGMDVAARRFTWDLIKQMSPGRTIVLTTHYMDEADLLGNSVSIMSKGALKCAGSSLFLKNRLGVGYTLAIACHHGVDTKPLIGRIQRYVPDANVLTSSGGELSLQLPMGSVPSFPAMLSMLEEEGSGLGVRSHGISVTTLEEVFLKIGHDESHEIVGEQEVEMQRRHSIEDAVRDGKADIESLTPHTKSKVLWEETNTASSSLWSQPKALLIKRLHNAKRDRRTQVLQIILPVVCILLSLLLTLLDFTNLPDLVLEPATYGTTDIAIGNCPATTAAYALPDSVIDTTTATTGPELSAYLLHTAKTHKEKRLGSFVCGNTTDAAFLLNNETGFSHSIPQVMQVHATMAMRAAEGTDLNMVGMLRALPLTDNEGKVFDSFQALMIGVFIMIPFTFIPSTFVSWVVKERECKAKHLQTVCGMNYIMYWCSNFVFDFCSFIVTSLLAMIIFLSFSRDEYVGNVEKFFATFMLMVFYGVSGVAGSYLMSFLFESHATAQNVVMMVNFIVGFLLVLVAYFMSIIEATKSVGEAITYIFRLWPAFCLGNGIINLASGGALSVGGTQAFKPWGMGTVGWNLIFMAVEAPVFFALTLMIDHPSLLKTVQTFGKDADPEPIEDEDDDVAEERRLVEAGERSDDLVVVKNFRKLYKTQRGTKLAVKNLSFAVRPGEVFGFLGTNGAGKTTAISMLCGEFLPTSGHGWIAGKDVITEGGEARKLLGYCPQFDALLDLLTVEEHLELYAGLRGLTGDAKANVVEGLIEACGLALHREKESRSLSGGNKRKLSVAMALVGGPQVVFLDEPSAGMDPMARRGLWDILEVVAKHCCIVLTTHHLEEVEALSTRVSIMDQGEMKCLGSLQHLKSKFGSGFEMSLRVSADHHVAAVSDFVKQHIAAADLQESRNGKLTYALPPETKLSQVFSLLEKNKDAFHVTDYSVSQTSLESVFLKISEAGRAEHEEDE